MAWHDNLNPETPAFQIASSTNPRVRVVAGPGTGKSFAMKRRVGRLLEEGVEPSRILPVTFTRVAAEDLHRELVSMGVDRCDEINGTTIHSLALRILMREHALVATGRTPRPLNEFEMKPLESDLAGRHGGIREVRKKIKAYEAAWARLQRDDPGVPRDAADLHFERDLLGWLGFHRAVLIGEVIPYLYEYLRSNPLAPECSEFAHILVDEFQDLNKAEQGVIELMSNNAHVCIVGDDDQSIYSFKHAHPDGILDWQNGNPGVHDLGLELCQRCPTTVVAMANALIGNNGNRLGNRNLRSIPAKGAGLVEIRQYTTIEAEVQAVAQRIQDMVTAGTPPGDILVLAQRGVIGTPIFEALIALGVPAKSYYAESELDAVEAQERFAYLKLLASPDDRVALRWLLGLGSADWRANAYHRIEEYCVQLGTAPWDTLLLLSEGAVRIPNTNHLVVRFQQIAAEKDRLSKIIDDLGLAGLTDDLFPDDSPSFREIRNLALSMIEIVAAGDAEGFVRELTSAIAKPEIPSEVTDVRIMSLHKSKGLSAPVTIIAGCVEGLLPKQPDQAEAEATKRASIEEQRRLFFVGITRVKSSPDLGKPGTLILTYCQNMPMAQAMGAGIAPARAAYGNATLQASRFIREMGAAAPQPIRG
jgi:DNA helicase II / ATP-dependent DNA helicase PcrA